MDVHARIEAAQGAARFIAPAAPSFDRLASLRAVLEAAAAAFAEGFGAAGASPVSLGLAGVESVRPGSEPRPAPADVVATLLAEGWDEPLLLWFERPAVWLLTDAAFGADGTEPLPAEPPPCSATELRVARAAADAFASLLAAAFAPHGGPPFACTRAEPVGEEAGGKPVGIVARFALQALGHGAVVALLVPACVLPALKACLPAPVAEDAAGADPVWARLMEAEIKRTVVGVRAVLEEEMTLGTIFALKVGQILPLTATPRSRARMESAGRALFWCDIGQGEGTYTVRIDAPVEEEKEPVHAVARH